MLAGATVCNGKQLVAMRDQSSKELVGKQKLALVFCAFALQPIWIYLFVVLGIMYGQLVGEWEPDESVRQLEYVDFGE